MKLLVTGGSGFLGSELALQARAAGWEVVATHRSRPVGAGSAGVATVPLDVTDATAIEALLTRERPDCVVNTAYVLSGPDLQAITAEAPGHVARACLRHGARLIQLSSDLVFDGRPGGRSGSHGGYTEADPALPIIPYGEAKAAAEAELAALDPGALVVRTSLLLDSSLGLGPQETRPLAAARGELELGFFSDEWRTPLSVRDLAAALLEAAPRADLSGLLHIAGPDRLNRLELAQLVCLRHGADPAGLRGALAAALAGPRPLDASLDSSRAAGLLATRIRGIREVLAA